MANAESFEEVEALSYTDSLTGLANQRYFKRRLDEEIGRAARYGRSLALIIFDLDELKSVNDCYGHQAGDSVIQQMGDALKNSIRSIDVVARYGGDEFAVILVEADSTIARTISERLRSGFKEESAVTASVGYATYEKGMEITDLIGQADRNLYRKKNKGQ